MQEFWLCCKKRTQKAQEYSKRILSILCLALQFLCQKTLLFLGKNLLCKVPEWTTLGNYFLILNKGVPGKKVRRDPANPAWDPRFVPGGIPGGIPPIPPGIPTGILEPPTWDPALNPRWDPANPTRDPSYILDKIPHGIWPQIPGGIPPIPPGIPASFHAKSHQWDPKFVPYEIPGGIPQSHLGLTCLRPKQDPIY